MSAPVSEDIDDCGCHAIVENVSLCQAGGFSQMYDDPLLFLLKKASRTLCVRMGLVALQGNDTMSPFSIQFLQKRNIQSLVRGS